MGTAQHFIKKGAKKLVLRDYKGRIEDYTKAFQLKYYYASRKQKSDDAKPYYDWGNSK
jgi:hypothetical protein